jgi:hypothetical protein
MPPAKKYQPMLADPLAPAPRHPMSVQLNGVSDNRKPMRALLALVGENILEWIAYSGVGLPKVFRNSPLTLFWGDR